MLHQRVPYGAEVTYGCHCYAELVCSSSENQSSAPFGYDKQHACLCVAKTPAQQRRDHLTVQLPTVARSAAAREPDNGGQ